jgi:hypothetical protein
MWEPRRLTTLWVFMACYRDSFAFTFYNFWGVLGHGELAFNFEYIVTRLSDRRRGIGLTIGFIGHFNN